MTTAQDGSADFDFLVGSWKVQHRRLRERLKGSTDWEEFQGTSTFRKILGGVGNFDENVMYRESGRMEGVSLRLFNPQAQEWCIYWASHLSTFLDVPTIGKFKDGRGEFYCQDTHDGKHVFCRFIWSEITPNTCHWEQALSEDGGKTWETNWLMEFTRQS